MLSWQGRFRAIFTGLVLADLWGSSQVLDSPSEDAANVLGAFTWRQAFIQTAQLCGQAGGCARFGGELLGAMALMGRSLTIASPHPLAIALATLPWMLLRLDSPSQGEAALSAWLELQRVPEDTYRLTEVVFQILRRGMRSAGVTPSPLASSFSWLEPAMAETGSLSVAAEMMIKAQGQYGLVLQWANQHPQDRTWLMPLVGLFSALHTGISGIPLGWRLQHLNPHDPESKLMQRWAIANEAALWQLADSLFYRWIGVFSQMPQHEQPLTYPVVQVGTALDWATQESRL